MVLCSSGDTKYSPYETTNTHSLQHDNQIILCIEIVLSKRLFPIPAEVSPRSHHQYKSTYSEEEEMNEGEY